MRKKYSSSMISNSGGSLGCTVLALSQNAKVIPNAENYCAVYLIKLYSEKDKEGNLDYYK